MKKAFIAFMTMVLCFGMMIPSVAFADETIDAHFYVRYDSSNQAEDGTTHYNSTNYFPIGEVADGYEYGSNRSDVTSVDGQVYSNTAYVEGAEGIITESNVNLYHSFNATPETVKDCFGPVYDNIAQSPSKETISASILAALGSSWQQAYDSGKADVLWYVTKLETDGTHVDGCLYWVKTGDISNKDEDIDANGNIVKPGVDDPEPEPTPEPTPDVKPNPSEPDLTPNQENSQIDSGNSTVNSDEQVTLIPEKNNNEAATQEVINDNNTPLASNVNSSDTTQMPQTGDVTCDNISLMGMIATMSLIIIVLSAYRRNGYEKVSKKQ